MGNGARMWELWELDIIIVKYMLEAYEALKTLLSSSVWIFESRHKFVYFTKGSEYSLHNKFFIHSKDMFM